MNITAIITHYGTGRISNLLPIVKSLQDQVDDIIVWNNDERLPEDVYLALRDEGVLVIQLGHNLGCQGRFAAVEYAPAKTTHVLFHDNDLLVGLTAIGKLEEEAMMYPHTIISAIGEIRHFDGRPITISFAKVELVPVFQLRELLRRWHAGLNIVHDDLWLSTRAAKHEILIRLVRVHWKNFNEVGGFWKSMPWSKWQKERARVFEEMMR